MSGETSSPQPPGGGDSWESLAEDLFGIDFQAAPEIDEIAPIVEPTGETAETSDAAPAPDEAASEPEPAPAGIENVQDDEVDNVGSDEEADESSDQAAATAAEAKKDDDDFWDPLNEWQWGESSSDSSGEAKSDAKKTGRRERKEQFPSRPSRPVRVEEDFASPQDLRDEYNDDFDFGAGLVDDEPTTKPVEQAKTQPTDTQQTEAAQADESVEVAPEDETTAVDSELEASFDADETKTVDETEAEPKKRRRRRRRRRRPTKEASDSAPAETEADEAATKEGEAVDEAEESTDDTPEEEPKRPPRRRPSRRGRRSSAKKPPECESVPADEATATVEEDDDEDDAESSDIVDGEEEADSGDQKPRYRNVPTWEEAIGYLLNPSHSDSKSSEAETPAKTTSHSGSRPKKEGSKSPSRRGRRRR